MHREKLFSADARRTTLTRAFTGRLARSIHNDFIDALRGKEQILAPYPVQAWLTAQLKSAALAANRADVISLWSGQGAPLLKHRRAARAAALARQQRPAKSCANEVRPLLLANEECPHYAARCARARYSLLCISMSRLEVRWNSNFSFSPR